MNTKRHGTFLIGAIAAAVALFAMASPAMAASSVTVNAQVEAEAYSITLDQGANLDYGAMDTGEGGYPWLGDEIVVRNIGTQPVRLDMLGSNPYDGMFNSWAMSDVEQAADQCMWVMHDDFGSYSLHLLNSVTTAALDDSLDSGSSEAFRPEFWMPTSTTGAGRYYWTGTIYASAVID